MIHVLAIAAIAVSSAVATPPATEWQADYGKALAATRTDDRPLLVVLDVPSDPKSIQVADEQSNLLSAYQLCHIDASTEYGQKVAKVFHAEKFPFTAIIDKTGSVVLHKKQGQLSDSEWNETLAAYQSGERSQPVSYTTGYRGEGEVIVESPTVNDSTSFSNGTFSFPSASPAIVSPSYCPSCQRGAQQSF